MRRVSDLAFEINLGSLAHTDFRPVREMAEECGFGQDAQLYLAPMEAGRTNSGRLMFTVNDDGIELAEEPTGQEQDDEDSEDIGDDALPVPDSDSDAGSVLSADESGGSDEEKGSCASTDEDKDEGDKEGDVCKPDRLPKGTNVIDTDSYFTLIRDPKYDDAKMVMRHRWARKEEMGTVNKSKTLKIKDYDPDGNPDVIFLVLRAWKLMRAAQHGWAASSAPRLKWLSIETDHLKADIRARNVIGGGTGCPLGDKRIREWFPAALA